MPAPFNYYAFHRRRKFLKILGFVLVLLGLFTVIDLMSNVPIPLTGYRAIFVGGVLIIIGFVLLYRGYKLPLEEALEIIHQRGRGITESELVFEMRVDRPTANRIIQALIAKGFLRASGDPGGQNEPVYEATH